MSLKTHDSKQADEYLNRSEQAYNYLRNLYLKEKYPGQDIERVSKLVTSETYFFYARWYKERISSGSKNADPSSSSCCNMSSASASVSYPSSISKSQSQSSLSSLVRSSCSSQKTPKLSLRFTKREDIDHISDVWFRVNSSSSTTQRLVGLDILSLVSREKIQAKIIKLRAELNKELRDASCCSFSLFGYYLGFGSLSQKEQDITDLENFTKKFRRFED